MIFHVIISYCENIFFILYISTIYLLRNIVESSRTTSWRQKLNTKRARWTIAPCLPCCEKFLDREDTKVYIYIYIRFSSMNILLVNFEHSSDWSEWLLRVFFIPSIPFRKIRDRGREILFYAIKLELPSWDDKEDWLTIYVKFVYI